MINNEAGQKILLNLRDEFDKLNEMWVYTKDMEAALNAEDEQSFGLLLDMRKKLMDTVDILKEKNRAIVSALSKEEMDKINLVILIKDPKAEFETPLENDIFEAKKRISALMKKLVEYNAKVEKMLKANDR